MKSKSEGSISSFSGLMALGATIGNGLSKALGAIMGLIYFPLTLPFIYAVANMHGLQQANKLLWKVHIPTQKQPSSLHYFSAALIVAGYSLFKFTLLLVKFPVHTIYSLWLGLSQGFKNGLSYTLLFPAYSFNRYYTTGDRVENTLHFRSKHVLALGLIFTLVFSAAIATIVFFFPWILAPTAVLTQFAGINLAAILGVKAVGLMLPLLNFASLLMLTLPAVFALEAAVFALIYLGKETGEFVLGIKDPKTLGYQGNRFIFAISRIAAFIDKSIAIIVGMPLYLLFKPYYQLLDSVRTIYKSDKGIWNTGKTQAEKQKTFMGEWLYKLGLGLHIIANTIVRTVLMPLQMVMTLLYAPLQCVRHATKYGTVHVLAYPHHSANTYSGQIDARNYDKVRVFKYDNVYYFRKKHIAIIAVVVGLTLLLLSSFFPPLGYISINLSLKALTPLGLAQFNLSGAAFLIINFITGVAATTAIAIGMTASSWFLYKISIGLSSLKRVVTSSHHFHNVFHSSVTAGHAFRTLKNGNLAVKVISSTVDKSSSNDADEEEKPIDKFGASWLYNFTQLLHPSGVSFARFVNYLKGLFGLGKTDDTELARPVYLEHDKVRMYERNKIHDRRNPTTAEIETRKMSGERGRVKIWRWLVSILTLGFVPAYTKKTGVSLAPNDGQMAFFGGRPDPVSMALDLSQLDTKGEKYVFKKDAWTNLKWWWKSRENLPKVKEYIQRSTSIQELRNINRSKRHRNKVPVYNEILACLTASALQAIVVSSDDISFRINALLRKLIFKYELGIDLPIIIMGTLCFVDPKTGKIYHDPAVPLPAKEYTVEEQLQDLITVTLEDHDAAHIFNKVAKHYSPDRDDTHKAKESFVRTLTNSHPVNWGTFFKNLEKGGLNKKAYTNYIKRATAIDLDQPVDHKLVSSHFTPSVAY